jgi:hypothetical protein
MDLIVVPLPLSTTWYKLTRHILLLHTAGLLHLNASIANFSVQR